MATTALIIDQNSFEEFKNILISRLDNLEKHLSLTQNADNDWLTSQDVKRIFQLSHSSLQKLRDEHNLPTHKIGGKLYYKRQELDEFFTNSNK